MYTKALNFPGKIISAQIFNQFILSHLLLELKDVGWNFLKLIRICAIGQATKSRPPVCWSGWNERKEQPFSSRIYLKNLGAPKAHTVCWSGLEEEESSTSSTSSSSSSSSRSSSSSSSSSSTSSSSSSSISSNSRSSSISISSSSNSGWSDLIWFKCETPAGLRTLASVKGPILQ